MGPAVRRPGGAGRRPGPRRPGGGGRRADPDRDRPPAAADRLRAAAGHAIEVRCAGAGPVHGLLARLGPDWLLLAGPGAGEVLVPLGSVLALAGLGRWSLPPAETDRVGARLALRHALGGIARDRAPVQVVLADGTTLTGTVDRVGADFLELAEHAAGEPRRPAAVTGVRTVPLPAVGVLRRY